MIPLKVSKKAKDLLRGIEDRGVGKFRNRVAGQVWGDELRRPLTVQEVEERLNQVLGGNVNDVLQWTNRPKEPNVPTVAGITEMVHEQIGTEWGFPKDDLLLELECEQRRPSTFANTPDRPGSR